MVSSDLNFYTTMGDSQACEMSNVGLAKPTDTATTSNEETSSLKERSRTRDEAKEEREVSWLGLHQVPQLSDCNRLNFEREQRRLRLHPQQHARYLPWHISRPYLNFEFTRTPVPRNTVALGVIHDSDCPICHTNLSELSGLYNTDDAKPKSGVPIRHGLACHHNGCGRTFHRACFMNWDDTMIDEGKETTCPVCRQVAREHSGSCVDQNPIEPTQNLFPESQRELDDILNSLISQDIAAAIRLTDADRNEGLQRTSSESHALSVIHEECN